MTRIKIGVLALVPAGLLFVSIGFVASRSRPKASVVEGQPEDTSEASGVFSSPGPSEKRRPDVPRISALAEDFARKERDRIMLEHARDPERGRQWALEKGLERDMRIKSRHERDSVDPNWGPPNSARFGAELNGLRQRGGLVGQMMGSDCRSDSCVASFEWEDYDVAEREMSDLVSEPYSTNCSRSMTLPVNRTARPVRADLVMDCAEWKAGGSIAPSAPP